METLIDSLLGLARAGTSIDDPGDVDVGSVARAAWDTVATTGATLRVETDRRVRADRSRLQQLFENLLRNAVEHGREDVTVTVGALEDGFYVADDGDGVPPGDRERIFESGYTTKEDGTGFGLAIVTEIVEAHGWTVDVTGAEGGGARFEFTDCTAV